LITFLALLSLVSITPPVRASTIMTLTEQQVGMVHSRFPRRTASKTVRARSRAAALFAFETAEAIPPGRTRRSALCDNHWELRRPSTAGRTDEKQLKRGWDEIKPRGSARSDRRERDYIAAEAAVYAHPRGTATSGARDI
jgi:hypothetical protein